MQLFVNFSFELEISEVEYGTDESLKVEDLDGVSSLLVSCGDHLGVPIESCE